MKKFVLFIILGFVFLFCGCKKQASYEEVIDYSFVSPVEHQVCPFEDFQLDSLWLDLTFQDGRKKRVVAEENMLDASSKEKIKQSGSYEISFELNHIKKTIPLFLYDEELLKQNTVYLLHFSDEESFINDKELLGYDIKAPANSYFYNWYLDEDFTEPFSGNQVGIISLYANFITEPTYRVRFYHQDILLKEEYVKEGENATAPAMKSLDNYVFCGWSDSFNDIKENKDIYSIYKTDVLEVEFYDFEDNLIDVEYVSYGEGVTPPILEEREGYQFVGFSENLEKITTSLKVYPVYIEVGNILVRFYKNEISQENFLYSESIPIGSSLTFHWSIPHYTVKSIRESLEHIKNSMDVVVTYEPVLKYYYVDEELYETVYYDEEDPVAPSILNIRPGYWKQREDDPYSFDLFCYSNGYSCFINYEGTIEEVFYSAFLQYGAAYYLAIRDKTYQFYEWYYDKNFTKRITDFSSILNCAWIYGKKVDSYEEEYTIFDYKLEEDGYHMSYNWEYLLSEFPLVNIPETHEGYPVVSVDAVIIQMSRYVFIPKTIVRIDGSITSLTLFNTKYFFVSEENPVFIAQYWLEDRNMLLKVCDDKQIITGFYGSYNDGLNEIHLKKNMEFDWNLLSNSPIERLYLDEGVESFSLFFGHIRELYVSSTVQKIIDIVFAPDPISEYKLNQVIFSEDCHLESIPARLCNTEIPFIMPNSVKIIEGGASYRSQPYNFILPENHPYLKIENNLILSRDGTILVGLYSYSNTPLLEPPSTVTKFYYSFFQGLVELGYNEIQYPKDIVYTLTCNGVTCEVTKLIEDALYYYRFVNKKIFINENGDPILRLNMKFDTDL